jgi:hypothetical protein
LSYPDDARTCQTVVKADAVAVYQHADRDDPEERAEEQCGDTQHGSAETRIATFAADYPNLSHPHAWRLAMAQPPKATEVSVPSEGPQPAEREHIEVRVEQKPKEDEQERYSDDQAVDLVGAKTRIERRAGA